MSDIIDHELIREYARTRSEEAFGELVHRHVDLVYSTAFRVLRNASLAEEVTQRVFVALAKNALKLHQRSALTGWLHETTRNFAITTVRSEERRRLREQEAATLETHDSNDAQTLWDQMTPHLDGALAQLSNADRDAILLRYFERKTAREIGDRLGLTEEAAQKRAARALDRLRTIFVERGLAAPTTGLASVLSIQAIQSAPVGLTASVIAAAGTVETITPLISTSGLIMASTKIKIALAAALVAAVSTPLVIQHQTNVRLVNEVATFRQQNVELARLREENQRLATPKVDAREAERREQEHAELMRLRGEVASLRRAQVSELAKARPESAKPKSPAASSSDAPLVPTETLANVGFATPSAAWQTFTWASVNGDISTVANAIVWPNEETRAKAAAVFASAPESVRTNYNSLDEFMANIWMMRSRSSEDPSRTLAGYRILTESNEGDTWNLVVEREFADGRKFAGPVQFAREGNSWKRIIPEELPDQMAGKFGASGGK